MIDDFFPLPYRVLEENVFENETVSALECEDINVSWQPIYFALFLTFIQVSIFLSIFEWGRRNKYVESVYDKRRSKYPTRTPAPLMKQRGCRIRLFQFEWWKIHITDEDYQKQSWDEFRRLKMEAEAGNWVMSQQGLAGEEFDPFITAAENQCYRESPFFPMLNDLESQKFGYGDASPTRHDNDYSEYNADAVTNHYDYDYDYGYDDKSDDSSQEDDDGLASSSSSQKSFENHGYDSEQGSQTRRQNNTQLTEISSRSTGTDYDDDVPCVNVSDNDYGYGNNWGSDTPHLGLATALSYEIDVSQSGLQQAVQSFEVPVINRNSRSNDSSCNAREESSLGDESQMENEQKPERSLPSLDDILGNVRPATRHAPQSLVPQQTTSAVDKDTFDAVISPPSNSSIVGTDVGQNEPRERVLARKRTLSQEEKIAEQTRLAEEIRRVDERLEALRKKKREREEAEAKQRELTSLVLNHSSEPTSENVKLLDDKSTTTEKLDVHVETCESTRDHDKGEFMGNAPVNEEICEPGITTNGFASPPGDNSTSVQDNCWSSIIYDITTEAAMLAGDTNDEIENSNQNAELDYGYESTEIKAVEVDYGYDTDKGTAKSGDEYGYGYDPDQGDNEGDYDYDIETDNGQRNVSLVPMKACEQKSNLNRTRRNTNPSNELSNFDPPGDHARSQSRHGRVHRVTVLKNDTGCDLVPNRRSSGQYAPGRRHTQGLPPSEQEKDYAFKNRRSMPKRFSIGVGNFLKRRVLMIEDDMSDSDCEENRAASAYVASKVSRRRLSEEDQELLRCIGLDSFVTLRFLQFGFDAAFWPMVVSIFSLIPLYKTGEETCVGFFTTTVINVESGSWRFWFVMLFGYVQMLYILRRLWIEWEVFLPLRYEFLENGDSEKEKYKEQYRKTCMIEYIPRAQKTDQTLYDFFDAIFPGEVQRAEVLLNTEHLTDLIKNRNHHIVSYETIYAGKVHRRAAFLRQTAAYQAGEKTIGCCRSLKILKPPVEPPEPTIYARQNPDSSSKKVAALKWHYDNITRLNKEIETEYMRLAQAQKRPVVQHHESRLAKWLGIKYLTGSDTGRLHSSTAFVEFKTMAAKQHAVQCNITGMNNCMLVTPVPEVRDLIWDNMHVSRALINTRKAWANFVLAGGLVLWSIIVSSIRNFNELSKYVDTAITRDPAVVSFLNFYAPALIVEGLVRAIPNIIKVGVIVVRFKARSERDHYVLGWYFYFRLITFIFIIVSDTIVDSSTSFVEDPIDFFQDLSKKVALNSQFFISYVIVTGGIQVFFRFSQWHNLALHWLLTNVKREEALPQRRLDALKTTMKNFHLDEFIPLFIFVFMVSTLYGAIAPLSGLFVALFFRVAYKVFKFMTLYVYGGQYEGGGFLFYTISKIVFYVLYMIITVVAAYLAVNGNGKIGGLYIILLGVVFFVQRDVEQTFVVPSKMLSLTKARAFDQNQDTRSWKEKAKEAFLKAKHVFEKAEKDEKDLGHSNHFDPRAENLMRPLIGRSNSTDSLSSGFSEHEPTSAPRRGRKRGGFVKSQNGNGEPTVVDAVELFNKRYTDENAFDTEDEEGNPKAAPGTDFFIYRQPTLNKTTWETQPKAYRDGLERDEAPEVWGDKRPEQVRHTSRARRASIAMCYGG